MKSTLRYHFLLALMGIANFITGQNFYNNYIPLFSSDTLTGKSIHISLHNNNFVKNNEYFGPYTSGITYIGSVLQPEATWSLSNKFSLSAGWYFRLYYGQETLNQSLPVIRARYNFSPCSQLIIGQLYGQLEHGFVEPVYSTDNYFIKNPEYGVQFLVNRKKLHADLYVDWEKFLMPGEDSQEVITSGLLASYALNDLDKNQGPSAHFQGIIHHLGGQVDISEKPLQTRANIAAGLEYTYVHKKILIERITLSAFYIQALELSPTNTLPFESGYGLQSLIAFENKWGKLSTGWFHGEYFFAPLGDYLFQSVSQLNEWYIGEKRDLITSKLLIGHDILHGVNFGFRLESYYDLQRKSNDLSFGLNISVNAKVFEKKLKNRED